MACDTAHGLLLLVMKIDVAAWSCWLCSLETTHLLHTGDNSRLGWDSAEWIYTACSVNHERTYAQ